MCDARVVHAQYIKNVINEIVARSRTNTHSQPNTSHHTSLYISSNACAIVGVHVCVYERTRCMREAFVCWCWCQRPCANASRYVSNAALTMTGNAAARKCSQSTRDNPTNRSENFQVHSLTRAFPFTIFIYTQTHSEGIWQRCKIYPRIILG